MQNRGRASRHCIITARLESLGDLPRARRSRPTPARAQPSTNSRGTITMRRPIEPTTSNTAPKSRENQGAAPTLRTSTADFASDGSTQQRWLGCRVNRSASARIPSNPKFLLSLESEYLAPRCSTPCTWYV